MSMSEFLNLKNNHTKEILNLKKVAIIGIMYQHFPANLDIWVSKKNPLTRKIEMEKGNLTF